MMHKSAAARLRLEPSLKRPARTNEPPLRCSIHYRMHIDVPEEPPVQP
jgi:hypothetical protein